MALPPSSALYTTSTLARRRTGCLDRVRAETTSCQVTALLTCVLDWIRRDSTSHASLSDFTSPFLKTLSDYLNNSFPIWRRDCS